jgi:hypothetical protein
LSKVIRCSAKKRWKFTQHLELLACRCEKEGERHRSYRVNAPGVVICLRRRCRSTGCQE